MSTDKTGGSAYPTFMPAGNATVDYMLPKSDGMTLLDYFAAMALPSVINGIIVLNGNYDVATDNTLSPHGMECAADRSYAIAEKMIEQRKLYNTP